jgi:hypothetical protein
MDPASVSAWIPVALAAVGFVFAALKGWDDYRRDKRIKDAMAAEQLKNSVQNAVGIVQQTGSINAGVDYVKNQAEEGVARFPQTDDKIAEKITAQIGLAAIATNLAVSGNSTAAVVPPLAPSPPGTTADDLNRAELMRHQGGLP